MNLNFDFAFSLDIIKKATTPKKKKKNDNMILSPRKKEARRMYNASVHSQT